ncbi:hypothetical protein Taro_025318 [Colocasia esculenta]|uniref:Uncharacterized protein n=1 Tax=Colocasia esculenta TaxID=4460 RepID=A0A843VDW1_COLES|nr:hypothetical protein [Colocasia esculenta]
MFLRLSSKRDRLRVEARPCSHSILGEERRLRRTGIVFVRRRIPVAILSWGKIVDSATLIFSHLVVFKAPNI